MLQTLTDIEVASALIKESKRSTDNSNPLDRNYARLKTTITPLDMSSPMAKLIAQYAYNSKAHSEVGDIVIDQIYAIERFVIRHQHHQKELRDRSLQLAHRIARSLDRQGGRESQGRQV